MSASRWLPLWLVLALVVAFAWQGTRGLYDTTEGRYAEAAREMLATGDWMLPQLEGHPHLTKPPLTYWAIATGMAVLGRNAWGVRLYGALAFLVTVAAVAVLGERLWDRRTGQVAALVQATALFSGASANIASTDVLLTMGEVLAVLAYWVALRAEPARQRWWVRGMWVAFGLAFFTKGYPALLPLVAIAVFHLLERRRGEAVPRLLDPLGLAAFVVVGGWWYAAIMLQRSGAFEHFVQEELVARVASNRFHRNSEWYKPFLYYLPALTLGLGLWLAAWPVALRWRGSALAAWRALWRCERQVRFLVWWLCIPLVVFFLAQSRLPLYVLPLFPVVALATARLLVATPSRIGRPRALVGLALASTVLMLGVKVGIAHVPARTDAKALARAVDQRAGPEGSVLVLHRDGEYGLTFYRGGDLKRVEVEPQRADVSSLAEALAEVQAGGLPWPVVFVASHADPTLDAACAQVEPRCRAERPLKGAVLYTFTAP